MLDGCATFCLCFNILFLVRPVISKHTRLVHGESWMHFQSPSCDPLLFSVRQYVAACDLVRAEVAPNFPAGLCLVTNHLCLECIYPLSCFMCRRVRSLFLETRACPPRGNVAIWLLRARCAADPTEPRPPACLVCGSFL